MDKGIAPSGGWLTIDTAPKDGTEIMLYYRDYCGDGELVVSGHWDEQEGREFEATWQHSYGHGDAEMWAPVLAAPDLGQIAITTLARDSGPTIRDVVLNELGRAANIAYAMKQGARSHLTAQEEFARISDSLERVVAMLRAVNTPNASEG